MYKSSNNLAGDVGNKLQCFGLGMSNGTVLADFYARTFRCMKYYYENEMYDEMYNQQMWPINISSIFNQYGGVAKLANVSIEPPRHHKHQIHNLYSYL